MGPAQGRKTAAPLEGCVHACARRWLGGGGPRRKPPGSGQSQTASRGQGDLIASHRPPGGAGETRSIVRDHLAGPGRPNR